MAILLNLANPSTEEGQVKSPSSRHDSLSARFFFLLPNWVASSLFRSPRRFLFRDFHWSTELQLQNCPINLPTDTLLGKTKNKHLPRYEMSLKRIYLFSWWISRFNITSSSEFGNLAFDRQRRQPPCCLSLLGACDATTSRMGRTANCLDNFVFHRNKSVIKATSESFSFITQTKRNLF